MDPRNERLFPCRAACAVFAPAAAPYINPQPLDLLIQRGKWDQETLRGLRLIPAAPLEHIHDDAPFDFVDDLEERRVRMIRRGAGTGLPRQWRQKLGELKTDTADDLLAANRIGQQIDVDALGGREDHRALHNVFEFTHVARPFVIHEQFHGRGREMAERLRVLLTKAVEEMRKQERNVFAAFAERGQAQVNDVQAVKEVLAEATFLNQGQEIDVRGGHNAYVHLNLLGAAKTHEFALLDDAKELCLRLRADCGDLVEEDGALIRDFEQSFFRGHGACERALDMTKELRFKQIDRNRSRVDGYEGLVRARRGRMNGLGDEFLAGAAFPADQHGRARRP